MSDLTQDPAVEAHEVIRSEEQLAVTTRRVPAARAVLRKVIVVEQQTIIVDVAHEEVILDQTPLEPADLEDHEPGRGAHLALPDLVLYKEEVVITKRLVPTERIRVEVTDVSEGRQITESVRHEQVDVQHEAADD